MTTLSPASTNSYRQSVPQVAAQAAIHLHNQHASIGTALFDRHGTLIFNNNALYYVNESVVFSLIAECLRDPLNIQQRTAGSATVYAVALDHKHVFVIAGCDCESNTVDQFLRSLRQVLPQSPATDD